MYIPPAFRMDERGQLAAFIRENSFAILFSQSEQGPYATHLPFLLEEGSGEDFGILLGHMARANPHWRMIDGQVLVVFHGPHTYISPTWYQAPNTVPTWNYIAVHVYGTFEIVSDKAELRQMLDEAVRYYESGMAQPWEASSSEEMVGRLLDAIVGFRIRVTRVEGKQKMNQNRPVEQQQRVADVLARSGDPQDQAVAALMRANLDRK